jgi:hypothetical protein
LFTLATIADTDSARRMDGLHDLDDTAIAKLLGHRRKQQTGDERLRWDHCRIAGLTLLSLSDDDAIDMRSWDIVDNDEGQLLDAWHDAVADSDRLLSWGGLELDVPLLHFRAMAQDLDQSAYWRRSEPDPGWHVDLRHWLWPETSDRPGLDETVRRLGGPGLAPADQPPLDETGLFEAWLAGDARPIRAYTDSAAIGLLFVASRWRRLSGHASALSWEQTLRRIGDLPQRRDDADLQRVLAAWGAA